MLEKIAGIIREYLGNDDAEITEDTQLIEDLGIASLDMLNLANEFEDEFGVTIEDKDIVDIKTVGDVIRYIESRK